MRKLASCPFVSLGSAFFFLMRMIRAFWLLFSRYYLQHHPLLLTNWSVCVAMQCRTIDWVTTQFPKVSKKSLL